jgi:hypothetical protein
MWIPGPITTVHNEHFCRELAAVARVGLVTRRWLSDKNRSADVVLGKHPYCVRRIDEDTCSRRIAGKNQKEG